MHYTPRFVLACVVGVVISTASFAADIPVKGYRPILPAAPLWSGFYVGANAGYGFANVSDSTGLASSDLNGFIGGAQVGYNWQINRFVLGVEADFQGSAQKKEDTGTILGTTFTVEQKIPWFATARARIGYAFDNILLFGTVGGAWSNYKLSVTSGGTAVSDDDTKMALAVGGGVEWMFMPRWSAKLEYLYIDTGTTSVTLFGTTFDARAKDNIVRLGVNYHF